MYGEGDRKLSVERIYYEKIQRLEESIVVFRETIRAQKQAKNLLIQANEQLKEKLEKIEKLFKYGLP